jgi:hypothetical protein
MNSDLTPVTLALSTDGGASWAPANAGFPANTAIGCLAFDPANSQTMYAGTIDKGIFKTMASNSFPVIVGAGGAVFSEGGAGSFRIASSGWPAPVFAISGALPPGLSFDPAAGLLSGTPASGSAGTYPLIVTASNGIPPDGTHNLSLQVLPATSVVVTITNPANGSRLTSVTSITGTVSGNGNSNVEVQVTDGTYYLQANGALTPTSTRSWDCRRFDLAV